ncbi:MAG: mannose-1-phosphate guanylyltransferase/mannose-6-phosphate isomerase [Coriobacteriia bacterium]|nr:mannose-1-phosphate guanylyltransferase/mannose-6-phosphate isomerase [Coriobacteriia bacterium]
MTDERSKALHAVILAGGSGSRFWPLSREMNPKQMLSVFGGVSLMTRAVRRIMPYTACDAVHVVTGERLFDEIRNHLKAQPELDHLEIDYLVEPLARNTAPAVALAAAVLVERDPESIMIMLPSDHLLEDSELWRNTIEAATNLAATGRMVTIGLKPSRPETGYGYIHAGEELADSRVGAVCGHLVLAFIEKPDRNSAVGFVADGGYLWNSGMLVAKAAVILAELEAAGDAACTHESADGRRIADVARQLAAMSPTEWLTDAGRALYGSLPAVPFDKAALEVSSNVAVVPTALDWSDVGSLLSIEKLGETDSRGNILVGRAYDVDSHDTLVYSADRLVATLGLEGAIVVDTADATLVASKDRVQDVRLIVDMLKAAGAEEITTSRSSLRPWGSWTLLMKCEGFQIKSIDVLPGKRLSVQSHTRRAEHWIVIAGEARILRGDADIVLRANESVYLPVGIVHRMENCGTVPLKVIEVAVGEYLGEDDIVRYSDDYGR